MSSADLHAIVEECKNKVLNDVLDCVGKKNLVSLILFGSIARDEPRFVYHCRELLLESDIDFLIVVKDGAVRRSLILLRGLSKRLTDELREKQLLLSEIELTITTEEKLLNARPSTHYMGIKQCGKVIFGKDLVSLMPVYKNSQIPDSSLLRYLFENMTKALEYLVNADYSKQEKRDKDYSYHRLLESIKKLTAVMIRVVLMKEDVSSNPWIGPSDVTDLRIKEEIRRLKSSQILDKLINSYIELIATTSQNSEENPSLDIVKKYWTRVSLSVYSAIEYTFAF